MKLYEQTNKQKSNPNKKKNFGGQKSQTHRLDFRAPQNDFEFEKNN